VEPNLGPIVLRATHTYVSPASVKRYAKVRLGIEQPTSWF